MTIFQSDRRLRPLLGFVLAIAILIARDPSHLLQAEFWAEDGWFWYPDAYKDGLRSLLVPLVGYFQTISRLIGLLAQPFALRWAPTVFAASALVLQALPPAFLLSRRMDPLWPGIRSRALFACLYVALPNTMEVYDNATNAQWHLAVLAFLVLAGTRPRSASSYAFDGGTLLLSGLSGPFSVVLAPFAAVRWWRERNIGTAFRLAVITATAAIQGLSLVLGIHARSIEELGAAPAVLVRILVQQVMLGAVLGARLVAELRATDAWHDDRLPYAVGAIGLVLMLLALIRGGTLLRSAALCGGALLVASMLRPQVSVTEPQWPLMTIPGVAGRYFFVPMMVWLGALFTLAGQRPPVLCIPAILLLLGFGAGLWTEFRLPERPRTDFFARARAFERAPPGTAMSFPVLPADMQPMVLVKRSP